MRHYASYRNKKIGLLLVGVFIGLFACPAFAETILDSSSKDGIAKVYKISGSAVLTQKGSPIERNLKVGDIIEPGDTVFTLKGASLSINFDRNKLNAVRIPADSKVTFTSIEPTEIKIESGSVFNVVDGLASGSSWKITTPTAVAAVRGTVFMTTFINGEFFAATLSVPEDKKDSMIVVQSISGQESANIPEGKQINLENGELLDQEKVKELSPENVSDLIDFFQDVLKDRPELEESADTATSLNVLSESKEMVCDASGKNCSTKVCKQTTAGEVCAFE